MSDSKTEGGSAPSPSVPRRTPEEWAAKTIHYGRPCRGPEGMGRDLGLCAFCQALSDDFRAAEAAGRAAALEDAAQIFEQKAQTCHPTYAPDRLAAGEYLGYADEIRALINQGRDEVAPNSPDFSGPSREEK